MKILSLSLDNSILTKISASSQRVVEYGGLVEKYTVIVPNKKNEKVKLSEKVIVFGSGGSCKVKQFINIYKLTKKILLEEKYDVISVQDQYFLALVGQCLSNKNKVGLEIQVHGFEKYYGIRRLIAKYVLLRASSVRCVSQRLKRQLVGEFSVGENKITVVPIFVDTSNGPVLKDEGDDNFIFLAVGRLVAVKNYSLQIEAILEIIKKYPNAELWIVSDGPEYNNLKLKILNLKLVNNIKLLGQKSREELVHIYNKADAFVLSSDSEGWGMAVIEAASFGLPIIMTDVGCAGEVIINNESGLIVPAGDKEKIIKAMMKIIEDGYLRKKIGKNARLAISKLPSKEEILNLYKISWERARIK